MKELGLIVECMLLFLRAFSYFAHRAHLRCLRLRWVCGLGLPQIGADALFSVFIELI
jgi:hypothetical protein